jgi:hypothetical protein
LYTSIAPINVVTSITYVPHPQIDTKFVINSTEKDNLVGADTVANSGTVTQRIYYNNIGDLSGTGASVTSQLPSNFAVTSLKNCIVPTVLEQTCSANITPSSVLNGSNLLTISPTAGLYDNSGNVASGILEIGKKRYISAKECRYWDANANSSLSSYIVGTTNSSTPGGVRTNSPSTCLVDKNLANALGYSGTDKEDLYTNDTLNKRYIDQKVCRYWNVTGNNILSSYINQVSNIGQPGVSAYDYTSGSSYCASLRSVASGLGFTTVPEEYRNPKDLLGSRFITEAICEYANGSRPLMWSNITGVGNLGPAGGILVDNQTICSPYRNEAVNGGGNYTTIRREKKNIVDLLDNTRGKGYIEIQMTAPSSGNNTMNQSASLSGTNFTIVNDTASVQYGTANNLNPTVTIDKKTSQSSLTNTNPINYIAVFNKAINPSTFSSADISISGTGSATVGTPTTNDNINWNIPVTATTSGTIIATINANVITDNSGNPNYASTSTINTVTYDNISPIAPVVIAPDNSGDNTPTITGSCESGATVTITITPTSESLTTKRTVFSNAFDDYP